VLYCLPALLLLSAAGLDSLVRVAGGALRAVLRTTAPHHRARAAVVAVLGVALAGGTLTAELPAQRTERTSLARSDDFRQAAEVLREGVRPGDAVVFLPAGRRGIKDVYPDVFHGVEDPLLTRTPTASGTLSGRQTAPGRTAALLRPYPRLWLVASRRARWAPTDDPAEMELLRVLRRDYRPARTTLVQGLALVLYSHR
jgi:mannosyltransferase